MKIKNSRPEGNLAYIVTKEENAKEIIYNLASPGEYLFGKHENDGTSVALAKVCYDGRLLDFLKMNGDIPDLININDEERNRNFFIAVSPEESIPYPRAVIFRYENDGYGCTLIDIKPDDADIIDTVKIYCMKCEPSEQDTEEENDDKPAAKGTVKASNEDGNLAVIVLKEENSEQLLDKCFGKGNYDYVLREKDIEFAIADLCYDKRVAKFLGVASGEVPEARFMGNSETGEKFMVLFCPDSEIPYTRCIIFRYEKQDDSTIILYDVGEGIADFAGFIANQFM